MRRMNAFDDSEYFDVPALASQQLSPPYQWWVVAGYKNIQFFVIAMSDREAFESLSADSIMDGPYKSYTEALQVSMDMELVNKILDQ